MEQTKGNGRTAEQLEWNAALADLRQRVANIEGEVVRLGGALDRMRLSEQRKHEEKSRLNAGLSPANRARVVLIWLRDAIQRRDGAPQSELLGYTDTLDDAVEELALEYETHHAR